MSVRALGCVGVGVCVCVCNFGSTSETKIKYLSKCLPPLQVLQWDHLLQTPPVYVHVACDVTSRGDDVIVLGSQEPPEAHCFQLRLNAGKTPPQMSAPLWKASKARYVSV